MIRKLALAGSLLVSTFAAPAIAADYSFTGTLPGADDVLFFDFNVASTSNIVLRTWSYAGGVNAAGTTIARGGFDPILSLYDVASGLRVAQNDDGGCGSVAADAVTSLCYDTYLTSTLDPGSYRVAVTAYSNFAPNALGGTFGGDGSFTDTSGNLRDSHWAFDILNVDSAVGPGAVPEPATWAMMILGFGAIGFAMRRARVRSDLRFNERVRRIAAGAAE
ncbi:MAG: DVUA0089 family protein [Sphingomonas bacterium]